MEWLVINLLALVGNSFYSMIEMACISFDRVRMQYYLSKGHKRMVWLNELITKPARLFGTTLIGVNVFLVIGSESARQFFAYLNWSEDLAALPQIFLVILIGELAPMFAARRYPEHVTRMGVPILYFSAWILSPLLLFIEKFIHILNSLLGSVPSKEIFYLGREEIQKILEVQESQVIGENREDELNLVMSNIFELGHKKVNSIVAPLHELQMIPSRCTVGELRLLMKGGSKTFFPVFGKKSDEVVGVVYPRDLLRVQDNRRVRDFAKQPWFIDDQMSLIEVLKQFRKNNESLAIVIDSSAKTVGFLSLTHILDAIMGIQGDRPLSSMVLINRTLEASKKIGDIEEELHIELGIDKECTLAQVAKKKLQEHPEVGESFLVGCYEITVVEASVFEALRVRIKTKFT